MASDQQSLDIVIRQKKEELTRNIATEETQNLKNSLLFQYNWPELLQSAPTAINSMGACFIAASSEKASVILKTPEKGFQYLRFESLQANLVETANLGRFAFNEAETGMGQISASSSIVDGKLKEILNSLLDPESARITLKPQMQAVKRAADTCAETAKNIEQKFNDWLFYACEMHAACIEQERTNQDVIISNEVCIAAESCKLDSQKDTVKMAKEATDLLGKQVTMSSEAFKKASDEYPSGWDIVGQQIVAELASTANTALKAMIPAMVMAVNPVAGVVSQGSQVVGSFLNKDDKPTDASHVSNGIAQKGNKGLDDSNLRQPVDPAAITLTKDMTYLELLNTIVNGPNGEIDWEKAQPSGSNAKSSISFVANMLEFASKSFQKLATNTDTSQKVKSVYDTATQVSAGIAQAVKDNKNASSNWPNASDTKVKVWIESFQQSYDQAQYISASVANSQGGPGSSQIISSKEPATGDGLDVKSTQGQAVLKSAQNRLDTTQKAYLAAQENYKTASSNLLEQQNKLTEIQGSLARLAASNVTLAEIKKILTEAIKLIIQLKTQVNNLVKFFSAFTVVISSVVQLHVEPFLATIKLLVSGQDDPNAAFAVGNYTLTDKITSDIYGSVLTLRAYYSVFGNIARMWIKLSIEHITPGMKMCDEVSQMDRDSKSIAQKIQELNKWTTNANKTISSIVEQTKTEILGGMEERFNSISETTKLLPPAPARKAIEAAKIDEVRSVAAALEVKKATAPIARRFYVD